MATELGKAYVQIMPSAKGIKGKIQGIIDPESEAAGKSGGRNIGSSIIKAIGAAGIGAAIGKSISEGAKLQQSLGGVETLFKDNANAVKKHADEAFKTTGLSANAYMENVTGFSASLLQSLGGDTEKAASVSNRAMIDMADNSNKMGTSMQDIQNAYQGFAKQNYTMLDNLKLGYSGTKKEMQRLLKDATKLSGVKYDIENLSDVYTAIGVVQDQLGITGTTALEAEETISGSLNAMKSAFTNVLGNLALGESVTPSLTALAETMSTFLFGNLFPMIGNIIISLPSAIVTFLQAAMTEIGQILLGLIQGSGGLSEVFEVGMYDGVYTALAWTLEEALLMITSKIPDFLEKGVELVTNIANGLIERVPFFIRGVGEMINIALSFLLENFPKFLEAGFEIVSNIAQGLLDQMPFIGESIISVLNSLLKTIIEKYPEYFKKGWEIIGKMAKGIWDNLPKIISTVVDLLVKLIKMISSHLPKFLSEGIKMIGELALGILKAVPGLLAKIPSIVMSIIKGFFSLGGALLGIGGDMLRGLWDGISGLLSWIVGKIGGIVTSVIDGFSSLGGSLMSVGSDMIKGLWNGISSVTDWILGKIGGFVDGILGGIKGFFGIKSPSRVMANEVGKYLPSGLAVGIEANTKPLLNTMEDLSAQTVSAFDTDFTTTGINDFTVVDERETITEEGIVRAFSRVVNGMGIEVNDRQFGKVVTEIVKGSA